MGDAKLIERVDSQQALTDLQDKGYFFIENAYSKEFCEKVKSWMDEYSENLSAAENIMENYSNTEVRIHQAQKKMDLLKSFSDDGDEFLTKLLGQEMKTLSLLAIRNKPLPKDDAESAKGRWHLDSFTSQVKIFLFLSDTSEGSGPFEFIPKTHKKSFKLRNIFHYFGLKDLFGRRRKYQHINEDWIGHLQKHGYPSTKVICKAGTLLVVDTTAIHRASPCLSEPRYALTIYYPNLSNRNKAHISSI